MGNNNLQIDNYAKYNNAHIVLEDCLQFATNNRYLVSNNLIDALGIAVEVLEEKLNKLKGETDEKEKRFTI